MMKIAQRMTYIETNGADEPGILHPVTGPAPEGEP